jgi:hypothetical protein
MVTFFLKHKAYSSQGAPLTNNTSGSIANFVVLALGELNKKFCNLVINLHLVKNGGSIVGHRQITIRRNENLVQAFWSKGCFHNGRHSLGSKNVGLGSMENVNSQNRAT